MMGRILCMTSNFPRWQGDSTTPFVLHLAQDLQALGWQIDVLAPHAPGCALRETLDGIHVERFRYLWPERLETVCYQGGALINLRKSKINKLKLPALIAAEWAKCAAKLASRRYDLLHSHWILPQGFTGVLAAKPLKIPHVVTVHGGDIFGLRGKLLSRFKKFALTHADAITVNSSVTRQAVGDLADLSKVEQIPMGVSTDRLADATLVAELRAKHRRGNGPLLVFVGRLVDEKGVEDLIRAVALSATTLPDVRGLIVGEGQDRAELEALAAQLGVAARLAFVGWVDPDKMPSYLAAGDVFVGPSRRGRDGWIEAQGLTFIEAMLQKIPVVATRSGGIVDSVQHEQTGLLVDERAPEQIAAAVERLQSDAELVRALRERAYAAALARFSRHSSATRFSQLFQSLTAEKRSHAC